MYKILLTTLTVLSTFATAVAEEVPEGIFEQPQGQVVEMSRSTRQYSGFNSETRNNIPSTVVFGDNGEVYFKDFISYYNYNQEIWVKGQLDGSTITVEFPQVVYGYNTSYTFVGCLFNSGYAKLDNQTLKFSYDDGVITQTTDAIVGICEDYGDGKETFTGYGNARNIYTPIGESVQTLPEGAQTESWLLSSETDVRMINVSFKDNDIYLSNLTAMMPDAVVKGTIEGDKAVFLPKQYVGNHKNENGDNTLIYAMTLSAKGLSFTDRLVMDYDAEGKSLSCPEGEGLGLNYGYTNPDFMTFWLDADITYEERFGQPMTPANPQDVDLMMMPDGSQDMLGYAWFSFKLPQLSVEGDMLNVNNLYYSVYMDKDDIVTFDPQDYSGLNEETTEMPATFSDGNNLMVMDDFYTVTIWFTGFTRLGVQSVYVSGGETRRSDIVYSDGEISSVQAIYAGEPERVEYYDLLGQRVTQPKHGAIYVKVAGGKTTKVRL